MNITNAGPSHVDVENLPAGDYVFSFSGTPTDGTTDDPIVTRQCSFTVGVAAPANQPPQSSNGSVTVAQDGSTGITLVATDSDGTIASWNVTGATNGTLSGTAPNLTYTPNTGYSGADSFDFTTTDDDGAISTAATVSITVTAAPPDLYTVANVTHNVAGSASGTARFTVPLNDPSHTPVIATGTGDPDSDNDLWTLINNGDGTYDAELDIDEARNRGLTVTRLELI